MCFTFVPQTIVLPENTIRMNTELLWNDRREWAKALYLHLGKSIREIAATVGADESTLSNWIKDGLWEEMKRNMLTSKKAQLERYYLLLENLNSKQKSENGEPNTRIINAIIKLTTANWKMKTIFALPLKLPNNLQAGCWNGTLNLPKK